MSRKNAAYRLLGLVYLILVGWIVAAIASAAAAIYMVVDVVMQLVTGGEGLNSGNYLAKVFQWQIDQTKYIFLGEPKSWPWTP